MTLRTMMKLAAALGLMASCALAAAQSSWRIATLSQPGSVSANIVDDMADKITKGSGGAIKAERLYMTNEQEMVAQLMRGRLELGALSNIATTVVIPEMALLGMPYLWQSEAERDFVTDHYALPVMMRLFEAKGLVIVGLGDVGWTNVFCKKACLTPADVKGMKVRVSPSAASKVFWGSLDTNGVQLPFSELIPGLQNGLVEAGELPFTIYGNTPATQSAPHYVMTRHAHLGSTTVISKALWNKLTPEQQKLVVDARTPVARARKLVADDEAPRMEAFKAKGGFVHELSAEQRAAWAKLVEPNQARFVAEVSGPSSELWAALQKGKRDFAARSGK
jgi:TRAP-type C4-dicarboxylate transport system substrate-binding protein